MHQNLDTCGIGISSIVDLRFLQFLYNLSLFYTKYMLLSHHQNAWQNHDIKIANRCFENVAQFRYLGMTITNQNLIQEENRLRVFENRVLRRLFGLKRDEVTGGWRKLHNEELHDLYSLPNIIRMIKSRTMRWAWHVARMGAKMNAYRIFMGKPEGKRSLGRPRCRWVDNIMACIPVSRHYCETNNENGHR
jgi:hypothetical protein